MDPRLLHYYNQELQHIREMGGEFAKEYPKIAGRLGIESFKCADPYVERLLEGFGYMAARVQLKVDAEFPRFTQHLLEMVYPHYLSPTPSMTVVQFQPDLTEGALSEGFKIERHTSLRSLLGKGEQTVCEYRTAHEIDLWPLELTKAEYIPSSSAFINYAPKKLKKSKAALRLSLSTTAGLNFNETSIDNLPIYLQGSDELPMHLYEQLLAHSLAVIVKPAAGQDDYKVLDSTTIKRKGYKDDEALLPYGARSFQGYRLLHEYFVFPERYMFVEFQGLKESIQSCATNELEIIILFDQIDRSLEEVVNEENFKLFCSPAINLFPKRADRIHLDNKSTEFHVIPDRTRPMDFEIYQIQETVGIGTSADLEQEFLPFYAANDLTKHQEHRSYFTSSREPRLLSSRQRRKGARSSYVGSEVFISLVDANEAPYRSDLKQLAINTLCTNRDLPLHMAVGVGKTDFNMETGAPVHAVRCLAGPSLPKASHAERETAWKLINHLSLNYLSLLDSDERQGAASLRELLMLYGDLSEAHIRKQVEGILSAKSKSVTRRMPVVGPISFGRGLEITLTIDEAAFEGVGAFLLGSVLEEFFAKYVSINSFTETVIKTTDRGEIMRWPVRIGLRHIL